MDIFLTVLAGICIVVGLIGCFFPLLPGPILSYGGLLILLATDMQQFTTTELIVWGALVVLVMILDYFAPVVGTKYGGGGKWGNRGCIIGTILGIFFIQPWGIIIFPFIGAVLGEKLSGKNWDDAVKAGIGSFIGFLFSVLIKAALCVYFLYCYFNAIF